VISDIKIYKKKITCEDPYSISDIKIYKKNNLWVLCGIFTTLD